MKTEPTASKSAHRDFLKLGPATTLGVRTGGLLTTLAEEVANPEPAQH